MKKFVVAILTCILILTSTSCSKGDDINPDIITGSGILELAEPKEESIPQASYAPESPDSNLSLQSPQSNGGAAGSSLFQATSSQTVSSLVSGSLASSQASSQQQSSSSSSGSSSGNSDQFPETPGDSSEVKSVWISYLELDSLLKGKSKSQFTSNIDSVFTNAVNFGLNTVFVQVRPFGDAIYPSDLFPWSYLATGTEGKDPGFDPLAIMVHMAHNKGLKIEAWINPYRVRSDSSSRPLSSDNQAQIWLNEGNDSVVKYGNIISYNPARPQARKLIIDGVIEIVQNYDVDGIHFDDYFYPTTDAAFDQAAYNEYKSSGGSMSLSNWRMENVNQLVRDVYTAVKSSGGGSVRFGISPQANIENNYNSQYSDVKKWMSNTGYLDYICPQVYFGFDNSAYPFESTVNLWNNLIKVNSVDLYIGLSPYKIGQTDQWAGSGKNEWLNTTDILKRMVLCSRQASKYQGFSLYRYDSLFGSGISNQVKTERENLKGIL